MRRREFLGGLAAAGCLSMGAQQGWGADPPELAWHDVRDWGIEGKGWTETEKYFDRFPKKAQGLVRDAVWNLSRHSAGMLVRFRSDAPVIWADYEVTNPKLEMPHMPATGVSGLDLYAEDEAGKCRWVSVMKPAAAVTKAAIIEGLNPGERNYTVYLPLYNGTESLKIGVPTGCVFTPIPPRTEKPLVFYGTSITHGACASRPGMPHPSILGRRLKMPVINLGFSGNGRMEREVGDLLTELDAAVYVIDCLPNMQGSDVTERAEPLVNQLRKARPETPIVLVEDRNYSNSPFLADRAKRNADNHAALKAAYERLVAAGVKGLFYLPGESLLGEDHDDTTDGSHPSDLGFYRHAEAFEPVLRQALGMA